MRRMLDFQKLLIRIIKPSNKSFREVLVDVARGIKKASQFLNKVKTKSVLAISSVTEMELLVGCRNKAEQAHLDTFLSGYKRITIDARISDEAVNMLRQFRLSNGLLIADAFIAATVKVTGAEFVHWYPGVVEQHIGGTS